MTAIALDRLPVVIVSGLPRSGTSMMMRMLAAGGVALITDAVRQPDDSNPLGFFEDERVQQLPSGNAGWLSTAGGCAVKVVSPLLRYLPGELRYRVIFMRRSLDEVMASQLAMLRARGAQHGRRRRMRRCAPITSATSTWCCAGCRLRPTCACCM